MNNLELKALYPDLEKANSIANEIGAVFTWRQKQTDTYFKAANGKLKLRQHDSGLAELIAYTRPEVPETKVSDYLLYPTENPDNLKEILTRTLGQLLTVVKQRTLYIWKNVRIHLDKVDQLGNYLEFEAILDADNDENISMDRIDFLKSKFEINDRYLIATGYFELLSQNRD